MVNRVNVSIESPKATGFSLAFGERTYRPVELRVDDAYEPRRLPEGSGASGVIGFKAPADVSRTDSASGGGSRSRAAGWACSGARTDDPIGVEPPA